MYYKLAAKSLQHLQRRRQHLLHHQVMIQHLLHQQVVIQHQIRTLHLIQPMEETQMMDPISFRKPSLMMLTENTSQRVQKKGLHRISIEAREEPTARQKESGSGSETDDETLESTRFNTFLNEDWEDLRNQTQNSSQARCSALPREAKAAEPDHQRRSGENTQEMGETKGHRKMQRIPKAFEPSCASSKEGWQINKTGN